MDPAIIGGGLNLLGSIFGKKKTMTPARSILSTARGVRMAAKETGLNALTLLGASNATAGAGMDMGTSPLASLSVLGSFIQDEFSDEAKQRKEHNRLQNELLTLEVERARTLSAVAPVASVAGGGALVGGWGQRRVAGPASGFLNEADRNPAVPDERDVTVSYQSQGQETVVPVGPDFDEVLSGAYIDNVNRNKAARARLARAGGWTVGDPLAVPPMPVMSGLGGGVSVPDYSAVMPPKTWQTKPKPKPKRKDLPLKSWEQKFTF